MNGIWDQTLTGGVWGIFQFTSENVRALGPQFF